MVPAAFEGGLFVKNPPKLSPQWNSGGFDKIKLNEDDDVRCWRQEEEKKKEEEEGGVLHEPHRIKPWVQEKQPALCLLHHHHLA